MLVIRASYILAVLYICLPCIHGLVEALQIEYPYREFENIFIFYTSFSVVDKVKRPPHKPRIWRNLFSFT